MLGNHYFAFNERNEEKCLEETFPYHSFCIDFRNAAAPLLTVTLEAKYYPQTKDVDRPQRSFF